VEAELGSKSSAYRCIAVAEKFEPAVLPTLGSLDLTTVYQLASNTTPDAVRQEVVERLASGAPLPSPVVREMVSHGRSLARMARAEAKLTEKQRRSRRRREARLKRDNERTEQEWEAERNRMRTIARQAADLLAKRLSADELRLLIHQFDDVGGLVLQVLRERPELALAEAAE
jgi:hypothetical protein